MMSQTHFAFSAWAIRVLPFVRVQWPTGWPTCLLLLLIVVEDGNVETVCLLPIYRVLRWFGARLIGFWGTDRVLEIGLALVD